MATPTEPAGGRRAAGGRDRRHDRAARALLPPPARLGQDADDGRRPAGLRARRRLHRRREDADRTRARPDGHRQPQRLSDSRWKTASSPLSRSSPAGASCTSSPATTSAPTSRSSCSFSPTRHDETTHLRGAQGSACVEPVDGGSRTGGPRAKLPRAGVIACDERRRLPTATIESATRSRTTWLADMAAAGRVHRPGGLRRDARGSSRVHTGNDDYRGACAAYLLLLRTRADRG